ncbi:MAG: DUF3795 domain-containing protein [Dehalococcoidia bacterium]|nr:DUF3795 domain-containing protein [Dehalococcoidia bacterium]
MNKPVFDERLVAPCGINCGICKAFLRKKNPCYGCNFVHDNHPKTIVLCQLRTCRKRAAKYCFSCDAFPGHRLKHLDKRYRTRYDMSEIENLEFIRDNDIKKFLEREHDR